ncbi:hypothetical protein Pan44_08050 [Caulifigura coniformis]|uniref:Uncharacterized protein n=1 Tax=Caulifigura coniformis TaxID=2527983 RepID=A0A517S9K8_9PLAN|nr:hypothetical protein [Caulifigura coniformis]QDT52793.1 hypothetical protein Pan44_08050 [Caulifigura coniformis]
MSHRFETSMLEQRVVVSPEIRRMLTRPHRKRQAPSLWQRLVAFFGLGCRPRSVVWCSHCHRIAN